MKNRKLIKTVAASIVCSAMALTAFGFAACNNDSDGEGETPHYHTYSSGDDWAYDSINHWRYATCGHDDLTMGVAPHNWVNGACTVCGAERLIIQPTISEEDEDQPVKNPDGTIGVEYEFFAQDYEAKTYEEDLISGIFTVVKGTPIRSRTRTELKDDNGNIIQSGFSLEKSIQMASNDAKVKFRAPAAGKLIILAQDGSGKTEYQELTLAKPGGGTQKLSYPASKYGSALQYIEVNIEKEGEYSITRVANTTDIFYMSFTANVQDSPVESISVASVGTANYYVGQEFSINNLAVNATHEETGRISPIQTGRLAVDYTAFNNKKAGVYEILVSYTKEGHTYETSYYVNVYSYDDLTLGTDKIVKEGTNTSAGNGVYANHSLRQFYFTGETLSTDGISVILNGTIGDKTQNFLLNDSAYSVSEVDMTTPGKKTVTVSYTTGSITKSKTFQIFVVDKDSSLASATSVELSVNKATADANVGVKSGDSYQFQTIHQALEFLENSGVPASANKTINLAAGNYWEKVEIKVPNLTIVGEDKDTTWIEYDALYGIKDAGGFEHTTDSTATLNVREKATNFTIKNVTVSNYYNSVEHFDERLGAGYPEHRALALLVQADMFTMDNCNLLGYQDTVEFFTGRQFIVNSYIAGTTDFIFGTNNTTYFYGCEIHSIYNGSTDGGYITAFKGNNKDANDAVTYGAVFDRCHFTADDEVFSKGDEVKDKDGNVTGIAECGNTALGRPWGAYAAVAVINSEIDGHVSTVASSGASKNERYVAMSGVKPTDGTVKFVEYNNTGDGAIDSAVAGMTMLSAADGAKYSDLSEIFGTNNGGVSYNSVWLPVRPDAETHKVTVKNNEGTPLFELVVEDGSTISIADLNAKLADTNYSQYDIDGVYTNAACTDEYEYDLSKAITDDTELYVTLVEGPFSVNTNYNFRVSKDTTYNVTEGTKEFGKLVIDATNGSFENNGGDWYAISGATLSMLVQDGTVVSVNTYFNKLTYTFSGNAEDCVLVFVDGSDGRRYYNFSIFGNGKLSISASGDYIGSIDIKCNLTKYNVSLINSEGQTEVSNWQAYAGTTLTSAQLDAIFSDNGITPPQGKEFDAYYANPECTTAFDFNTVISANTPVYIGWKDLPTEIEALESDATYDLKTSETNVAAGSTKIYNGIKITGAFTSNGSGWSQIANGGSISLKIKNETIVTVTTYQGGLTNATCDDYTLVLDDAGGNGKYIYTITALKDCELVLSGDGAYISTVDVNVKTVYYKNETIDFRGMGGTTFQSNSTQTGKYAGVEIDASNSGAKFGNSNGSWVQANGGAVLKIYVTPGANVTASVATYNNADIAVYDYSHLDEGYILITLNGTNDYISTVTLTFA